MPPSPTRPSAYRQPSIFSQAYDTLNLGLHPNLDGFIDLTGDASPPASNISTQRRQRSHSVSGERTTKRRRVEARVEVPQRTNFLNTILQQTPQPQPATVQEPVAAEQVDLTGVDDDAGLRKLQNEQRLRHDAAEKQKSKLLSDSIQSQRERDNQPVRFSTLQCVVCMENMVSITATHCGHLFCHTCIMEALIAGENQEPEPGKCLSRCPICRKKVVRPKPNGKDQNHVIPLEIKLKMKSDVARGKEKVKC